MKKLANLKYNKKLDTDLIKFLSLPSAPEPLQLGAFVTKSIFKFSVLKYFQWFSPTDQKLITLLPYQSIPSVFSNFVNASLIFFLFQWVSTLTMHQHHLRKFFFWPGHVAPRTLVLQSGTEPGPLAVKVPNPNHCTARELHVFFKRCQGLNPGILF